MNDKLTEPQIASYRDNGFIVIENFLTSDELAQWREAVDEAVGVRGGRKLPNSKHLDNANTDNFYDNVFIQRLNLWQTNDKVKKLILDPRIGKMCCDLEGVDGFRVWHDQALIKEPWANPTSWHLDDPYWSFSSRNAISIWVALDDATFQNGCLYFLPGSHKQATYSNAGIGPNMRELFKVYPQWKTMQPVPAPMKAGSCSFHNGLTAHAAGPNMTPGYRRAMTCAYMPAGATFNGQRNILTEAQVARLKVGDELCDDEQNPIVYARRQPAQV